MKIERLETHDRLKHLIKDQSANIFHGAEDCLKKNPLSLALQDKSPYIYIFAHPRTADDGVNKVMYWQPRLSIPEAQTNSYLFRAISKTDIIEVIWMIPPREHWEQYKKDNITDSNICRWSIAMLLNNKKKLEQPHPDDISEDSQKYIMQAIIQDHKHDILMKKLYLGD